ncbi:MAG: class I SAM-dependent methyltransferase [Aigarchaeota archaeon]|jgi:ubiquinone/menaquinone biosynthesis C-methylase UbiE|nr:class I SAM-dependent methyltransferase [Candidatus Caldarchaeales archaeon]MDJ0272583.1 class I SAM-dependent methyltransferase [Candidatus Caldarchaeales archaeon]
MNAVEALAKIGVNGKVLIIGGAGMAADLVKRLGLSEAHVADDDSQSLQNLSTNSTVKITPVYTRVIERLVELPSTSFDTVVAVYSLERALNKRAFMTEVRRLLKQGGKLIVLTHVRSFLRRRGLPKTELDKLLATQGFKLVERIEKSGDALCVLLTE